MGTAILGFRRPFLRHRGAVVLACVALLAVGAARFDRGVGFRTIDVARVEGSGSWGQLACLSCLAVLAGSAGGSIGGMLFYAMLFPEAYGACAYICYEAFT